MAAIEERDGVAFYIEPTSPLSPIKLVRTPGFRRDLTPVTTNGHAPRLTCAAQADVLLVSLGSTAGLRASDAALAAALRRAGAHVEVGRRGAHAAQVRTLALTDLAWARAARVAAARAALRAARAARDRSTRRSAPRCCGRGPGAIRYDAPAAGNRPGRHGIWQRPVERRRLREAPLLVPVADGALAETPSPHAPAVVVPIAGRAVGPTRARARDIAAITYAADPWKKGLDRVLAAWAAARRDGEELVVAGTDARRRRRGRARGRAARRRRRTARCCAARASS